MFHSPRIGKVALISLLSLVLVIAGCYGSKFTLIAPDKAKVDRAYVGDWDMVNSKGDHAAMTIRNIDDKLFYIDTRVKDDVKADRYVGFLAPVGTATFAHVRPLSDDGSIPEAWILMRIQLTDGTLALRQLDEEFFKEKPIESAEQLRQIITSNVENDKMYAKDEVLTGKKIVH